MTTNNYTGTQPEKRMVELIRDYVGEEVVLFIHDSGDWSWLPAEEFVQG